MIRKLFFIPAGFAVLSLWLFISAANYSEQSEQPCDRLIAPINAYANVRQGPGTNYQVIATMSAPARVQSFSNNWYHLAEGGYVYSGVVTETCATSTPAPTAIVTIVQGTPTRIVTNTPLPPALRTQTAMQYAEQVCVTWPNNGGQICSLYPFGSRMEWQTIQVQP